VRFLLLTLLCACSFGSSTPSASPAPGAAAPASGAAAPAAAKPSAGDSGTWTLPDGKRLLATQGALKAENFSLSTGFVGAPSWDATGKNVVFTEAQGGNHKIIVATQAASGWSTKTILDGPGKPTLPVLAPDGTTAVFVWEGPLGGQAGIWLAEIANSSARPLTNSGFGDDPSNKLPVPTTPPTFDGKTVKWTSPAGQHEVGVGLE
jgi:Tol biopolymer transport system component